MPAVTMVKLAATLRRHQLHVYKRDNLVYFAPPLVITEAELDEALGELGARSTRRWRERDAAA